MTDKVNTTELTPLSSEMASNFYRINDKKIQVISVKTEHSEKNKSALSREKIHDIRVALTQQEYRKLRERMSEKHLNRYESTTSLSIQNHFADFNSKVEEIEHRQKPSKRSLEKHPISSRFYKFRWSFWDPEHLKNVQTFMHRSKAKLFDPLITLTALRNNPRSLLTKEDLKNLDLNATNINTLILQRLKKVIEAFKAHIEAVTLEDLNATDEHDEKLKALKKNVTDKCATFLSEITGLMDKEPSQSDVNNLFQNKHLGYFIDQCSYDLVDGVDLIVREMNGTGYWDVETLHPARKALSRIKQDLNLRAFSREGAQTVAERAVSNDMINSLIDDSGFATSVAEENREETKDLFWVSLTPYVGENFDMPDIQEALNIFWEDEKDVNDKSYDEKRIKSPNGWWTASILVASFTWEPVSIVARLVVGGILTIGAIMTVSLEKLSALVGLNSATEWFSSRTDNLEKMHSNFGKLCEKASVSSWLKQQRNNACRDENRQEVTVQIDSEGAEPNLDDFLLKVNQPVNEMHVLAEKYFSPKKWANSLVDIGSSILTSVPRFASEVWSQRKSSESPEDVFKRTQQEINEKMQQELERRIVALLKQSQSTSQEINPLQSSQESVNTLTEFQKECQSIQSIAITPKANLTTDVASWAHIGHEIIRLLSDDLIDSFLRESPGISTLGAMLAAGTFGLSMLPSSTVAALKMTLILQKLQIMPNVLGKNVTGQALSEGMEAKLFAAIFQYKAIVIAPELVKMPIDGDLGVFKKIFHNPEMMAFGLLCCTAVGFGLGQVPVINFPMLEKSTGVDGAQGPYVMLANFFIEEAHHSNEAAVGVNMMPYAFLGLKSLLFLQGLTEGQKRASKQHSVVENFFEEWNNRGIQKTSFEDMLRTEQGIQFQSFFDEMCKNESTLARQFDDLQSKIQTIQQKINDATENKVINVSEMANGSKKHVAESNFSTIALNQDVTTPEKTPLKKAFEELQQALQWIKMAEEGNYLTFDQKNKFFNSDPTKFYDHLHKLFENYNQEALKTKRVDLRIDGSDVLKDFYTKHCYKGTNNFLRALIWFGNGLFITPAFRRTKQAVFVAMGDSPAMREQFKRSRAKDIFLTEQFVTTAASMGHATARFLSQSVVAVVGGLAVVLTSPFQAMDGFSKKIKNFCNNLSDSVKLHHTSLPHDTFVDTANDAATSHDLAGSLDNLLEKVECVNKALLAIQETEKNEALASAVSKLSGTKKTRTLDILERLSQMEKTSATSVQLENTENMDSDSQKIGEQRISVKHKSLFFGTTESVMSKREAALKELSSISSEVALLLSPSLSI